MGRDQVAFPAPKLRRRRTLERETAYQIFCTLGDRGFSCTLGGSADKGCLVRASLAGHSLDELTEAIAVLDAVSMGSIADTYATSFEGGDLVFR